MQRLWCFNCFNDNSYNSSLLIQFPLDVYGIYFARLFCHWKTWKWLGNDVEDIDVWNTSPGGAPAAAWRPSWGGSCAGRSADLRVGTDRAAACWGSGLWVERNVMWPCATRATCYSTCVLKKEVEKLVNWFAGFGKPPTSEWKKIYKERGGFFSQPCWMTSRISSPAVPSKWWPRTTWTGKFRDAFLECCIFLDQLWFGHVEFWSTTASSAAQISNASLRSVSLQRIARRTSVPWTLQRCGNEFVSNLWQQFETCHFQVFAERLLGCFAAGHLAESRGGGSFPLTKCEMSELRSRFESLTKCRLAICLCCSWAAIALSLPCTEYRLNKSDWEASKKDHKEMIQSFQLDC